MGSKCRYLQDVVLAVDHVVLAVDDEGQRGKGVDRGAVDDVLPGAGDGLSAADHLIKVYLCHLRSKATRNMFCFQNC